MSVLERRGAPCAILPPGANDLSYATSSTLDELEGHCQPVQYVSFFAFICIVIAF